MPEWLVPYSPTVMAMGATGGLLIAQVVVADVAGTRAGHAPGAPIPADQGSFLFRASRAQANTNESVAIFILLALAGMLSAASPAWINGLAWTWLGARVAHMACYYAGIAVLRSVSFGVAMTALVGMLLAWLLS